MVQDATDEIPEILRQPTKLAQSIGINGRDSTKMLYCLMKICSMVSFRPPVSLTIVDLKTLKTPRQLGFQSCSRQFKKNNKCEYYTQIQGFSNLDIEALVGQQLLKRRKEQQAECLLDQTLLQNFFLHSKETTALGKNLVVTISGFILDFFLYSVFF